jgi:hypothetical protein
MFRVKILYVASELQYDGVRHEGRSLTRHFVSDENEVRVCGAIVPPDSPLLEGHLSDVVVPVDALDQYDVVYMESGWNSDTEGASERFPQELADAFVRRGGQLFVADVSRAVIHSQRQSIYESRNLFHAEVAYRDALGREGVSYLVDVEAEDGFEFRFQPSNMWLSDWLQAAMDGIDSILTSGPLMLVATDDIAASGQATTNVLVNDLFVEYGRQAPWATVSRHGRGYAVLVGAGISYDYLVERCPDNARWISNLMELLKDRIQESTGWLGETAAPHQHHNEILLARLLREEESQTLERKSSFLTPMDPKRKETPQYVLQHSVVKNIAALANTDGGHVIIGQADDGTIVGLADDLVSLNHSRDQFELKLVEYVNKTLRPNWAALALRVHWVTEGGHQVLIVDVPKSRSIVHLTEIKKADEQAVYVRSGTSSGKIDGPNLVAWIETRLAK